MRLRFSLFTFSCVTLALFLPVSSQTKVTHTEKKKLTANVIAGCSRNGACCESVGFALEFPSEKWQGECHVFDYPPGVIQQLREVVGQTLNIDGDFTWYDGRSPKEHPDKFGNFRTIASVNGETVYQSDEESIARIEQQRARLQPDEQLVVVVQDVYPHWNTYTVSLTPQNEEATLKSASADCVKLAGRKPTHQWVIVFRSRTDEPAIWLHIKKSVAEAAAK
jgi:hypothetical protein